MPAAILNSRAAASSCRRPYRVHARQITSLTTGCSTNGEIILLVSFDPATWSPKGKQAAPAPTLPLCFSPHQFAQCSKSCEEGS
jgi:hypothetical protein